MHKDSMGILRLDLLGTWERKQLELESDFENDLEYGKAILCSLDIEQRKLNVLILATVSKRYEGDSRSTRY